MLPVHRTFPAFQELSRPAVCSGWPRQTSSAARTPPPSPRLSLVSSPTTTASQRSPPLLSVLRRRRRPQAVRSGHNRTAHVSPYPFGLCNPDRRAPRSGPPFFLFFPRGPGVLSWAGPSSFPRPASNFSWLSFF
jgi:hypothetical protein